MSHVFECFMLCFMLCSLPPNIRFTCAQNGEQAPEHHEREHETAKVHELEREHVRDMLDEREDDVSNYANNHLDGLLKHIRE